MGAYVFINFMCMGVCWCMCVLCACAVCRRRQLIPCDQSYRKGRADRRVLEIEPVST